MNEGTEGHVMRNERHEDLTPGWMFWAIVAFGVVVAAFRFISEGAYQ